MIRSISRLAALLSVSLGALAVPPPAAGDERPPDVLLMIADDLSYHDLGCHGNGDVRTPNIDRLASRGMRFTRAYTATAMCSPTRQQLYTGVFPVRNGAYPNHSKVYRGTRSVVHHLETLGYRVGLNGKWHIGPAESFPFERVKDTREFIGRDAKQPYCLVICSNSPHKPWSTGDASAYDPQKLALPPYLVDTPETRTSLARYYAEITDFDRELGEAMNAVEKGGRAADTIFLFTSEQGGQWPRCKWTCYETGLRTALIVRWPARVKAGSLSDALVQYVDVVPTLIEAAGGDPAAIDTGRPGGPGGGRGFDGRSFLAVLKGESSKHGDAVFGVQTTRGIIAGSECYPIRSVRTERYKLIWNLRHESTFQNIVTDGRDQEDYWLSWVEKARDDPAARRLVDGYRRRPEFELYDLHEDPFELTNLAGRREHGETLAALKKRLDAWMRQQGDSGVETELRAGERKKNQRG